MNFLQTHLLDTLREEKLFSTLQVSWMGAVDSVSSTAVIALLHVKIESEVSKSSLISPVAKWEMRHFENRCKHRFSLFVYSNFSVFLLRDHNVLKYSNQEKGKADWNKCSSALQYIATFSVHCASGRGPLRKSGWAIVNF